MGRIYKGVIIEFVGNARDMSASGLPDAWLDNPWIKAFFAKLV
jgi:hypothetical protein